MSDTRYFGYNLQVMETIDKKFVPVMITPFNLKAKVDLDVVSNLIDFYLAAGVKGFFCQLPQQRNVQHQRGRAY